MDCGTLSVHGNQYHASDGFWFAGAQNPTEFAGRKALPPALLARVAVIQFLDLSESELFAVAKGRQVSGVNSPTRLLRGMCALQAKIRQDRTLSSDPAITIRELCRWCDRLAAQPDDMVAGVTHALELLAGRSQAPGPLMDLIGSCLMSDEFDPEAIPEMNDVQQALGMRVPTAPKLKFQISESGFEITDVAGISKVCHSTAMS